MSDVPSSATPAEVIDFDAARRAMDEMDIEWIPPSIYIAGPMTGIPKFNREAFDSATEAFTEGGWDVFNPVQHDVDVWGEEWVEMQDGTPETLEVARKKFGFDFREALGTDLAFLCYEADAIAMLPGWELSKGARAEHATAVALGLQIIYLSADVTED